MNPIHTVRVACQALLRNKMRSFLTVLGVAIGVFAVVAMVAAGDGAQARVRQLLGSLGTNMLVILPGAATQGGAMQGFGTLPTLTWGDLQAIRTEVPTVRYAAAQMNVQGQVQAGGHNWSTAIIGTSPDYFKIRDWDLASGHWFTQASLLGQAKVALLGQTVVKKLYGPGADPVGQTIRVKGVPFRVIGVLAAKGQSPNGQDADDVVFIPQSTYESFIQGGLQQYIRGVILVSAISKDATKRAQSQITAVLRERHHIQKGAENDFSITNLTSITDTVNAATRAITALLAAIAAISLLVGGIGIMNIMLVSVTERTREIGLRMAVGAKTRDILFQFVAESMAVSAVGGVIGAVLGVATTQAIAAHFDWQIPVRPAVIVVAIGFSALVGIVFGLYPARKASLLDPIEALRYE